MVLPSQLLFLFLGLCLVSDKVVFLVLSTQLLNLSILLVKYFALLFDIFASVLEPLIVLLHEFHKWRRTVIKDFVIFTLCSSLRVTEGVLESLQRLLEDHFLKIISLFLDRCKLLFLCLSLGLVSFFKLQIQEGILVKRLPIKFLSKSCYCSQVVYCSLSQCLFLLQAKSWIQNLTDDFLPRFERIVRSCL